MAVNFTKNQDEITKAWREVVDSKDSPKWALFGYEGNTNNIKLMATGSNGLNGLVQELNCSLIQYAFCRVINKEFNLNKLVLINWQGDSSPLARKGLCASHVGDVTNYFKGCTQTITIRNDDEASQEYLMEQILKTSAKSKMVSTNSTTTSVSSFKLQTSEPESQEVPEVVGSIYKKTDIGSEIPLDRKSFWQRQEEEEKARLVEEKKRAAEKQAQFEKERKLKEESEAKKLAETIRERDRLIEATRQAERLDSSSSQPSSILSTSNANQDDDDERVGRRSELIRLERNQETQSLISKGLIKNKRAIFEQASQQQQNQQQQQKAANMTRRPSGTIITQRLNTFKSMDAGNKTSGGSVSGDSHTDKSVEKMTNGLAKNANIDSAESKKTTTAVTKLVEAIKLTDDTEQGHVSQTSPAKVDTIKSEVMSSPVVEVRDIKKESPIKDAIKNGISTPITDSNGNVNHKSPIGKQSPVAAVGGDDSIEANANYGIRARALYDYEAADHTEISFDPEDVIGFIEKVDEGWWQGSVVTGQYAGQTGLFPSNYVQELS